MILWHKLSNELFVLFLFFRSFIDLGFTVDLYTEPKNQKKTSKTKTRTKTTLDQPLDSPLMSFEVAERAPKVRACAVWERNRWVSNAQSLFRIYTKCWTKCWNLVPSQDSVNPGKRTQKLCLTFGKGARSREKRGGKDGKSTCAQVRDQSSWSERGWRAQPCSEASCAP